MWFLYHVLLPRIKHLILEENSYTIFNNLPVCQIREKYFLSPGGNVCELSMDSIVRTILKLKDYLSLLQTCWEFWRQSEARDLSATSNDFMQQV